MSTSVIDDIPTGSCEKVVVSQVRFSALSTTDKIRKVIQSKLVKRGRELLGARAGEKVLRIFILAPLQRLK